MLDGLLDSQSAAAATRAQSLLASPLGRRRGVGAGMLLARAERGQVDHHAAYGIGVTYAQLGRPTDAVRWLVTAHDTGYRCAWCARDPLLEPLRGDAGFRALSVEMAAEWRPEGSGIGRWRSDRARSQAFPFGAERRRS